MKSSTENIDIKQDYSLKRFGFLDENLENNDMRFIENNEIEGNDV